jgi:DNA-binding response OmpR family regulator
MRDRSPTVLIVEDEPQMRDVTGRLVERAGMTPLQAADGRSGLQLCFTRRPDVVVLDLSLPELDGWEVLSRIREVSEVPVLMLTGDGAELQKVRGLRSGADDYVTKPFGRQELIARIEALLRRPREDAESIPPVYADEYVYIDQLQRRVEARGAEVELTPTEFRLLWALTHNANQVLSPAQLLMLAWGDDNGDPQRVKLYVGYLRRKLKEAAAVDPIETVRGFGYRYRPRAL